MQSNKFEEQYKMAEEAGRLANLEEPRAASARYDKNTNRIIIRLRSEEEFEFSPDLIPGLRNASASELSEVELTPSGDGLHWETLDEDLSIPALVEGYFSPRDIEEAEELFPGINLPQEISAQIEAAWVCHRDAAIADRLTSQYPEHAENIYNFFSLIVEGELLSEESKEAEQSARRTLEWLENEGFEVARSAAKAEREKRDLTPATPPEPLPPNSQQSQSDSEAPKERKAFLGLAIDKTGREEDEITEKMGVEGVVIRFVQREPPTNVKPWRRYIAKCGYDAWGIDEQEGFDALSQELERAALRRSKAKRMTPEELLQKSGMSLERRKFWLELLDEED